MLDKEIFIDSLEGKLRDDVQTIIYECHEQPMKHLDVAMLNGKLHMLQDFTLDSVLTDEDWLEIVFELCPEIYDNLDFGPIAA
jgi:hypothetical protein